MIINHVDDDDHDDDHDDDAHECDDDWAGNSENDDGGIEMARE